VSRADRHLGDRDLLALCAGEARDEARAHVERCAPCAARCDEFAAGFEALRLDAQAEADEVFTAERLDEQRDRMYRRVEHAGRPARVIAFPQAPSRGTAAHAPRVLTRWVAAAAAAGLIVGLFTGRFVERRPRDTAPLRPSGAMAAADRTIPRAPASGRVTAVNSGMDALQSARAAQDDQLLSDIETALAAQRAAELQALDALTPRVREIAITLR
jgi:hypothetical protein